jgi:hypothetical protein
VTVDTIWRQEAPEDRQFNARIGPTFLAVWSEGFVWHWHVLMIREGSPICEDQGKAITDELAKQAASDAAKRMRGNE